MNKNKSVPALETVMIPLALFLIGTLLRLYFTYKTHAPTLDTAVVGLMALEIQNGARPLFFAGQGYMGALEAYLTAGMFSLFGADRFTMTFAPLLFGAFWPVLAYFFLRRDLPLRSAVAGALFVVFPAAYPLWYSSVPYGGYPETYVFGMAMMLHAYIRLGQKTYFPWRDAIWFSLLVLLGTWTNLQIFPYLATAGVVWLYLLFPDRFRPRRWLPFALVPLALALAVIPQILISAENPASPPLFSSISSRQIAHSVKALFRHDLLALMSWSHPFSSSKFLYAIPYIGFLILGAVVALRKPVHVKRGGLALCGLFLIFFSILYFPHSMSGYVPRYLIAPFMLVVAQVIALSLAADGRFLRNVAGVTFGIWLLLQVISFPLSSRSRNEDIQVHLANIQTVIDLSREHNLTSLRYIGSGMEGHIVAAYSFQAGNDPTFVSSYDERRRHDDLRWQWDVQAGYVFADAFLPFVKGSLEALGQSDAELIPAGRYWLMPAPEPAPFAQRALPLRPEQLTSTIPGVEALMDDTPGTWPETSQSTTIRIELDRSRAMRGLRVVAPVHASLPYQYTIRGGTAEGNSIRLARSQQRLASSYQSGNRMYFKGFANVMDVQWPARELEWIEFEYRVGRLNKDPILLERLHVFEHVPDSPSELDVAALKRWVDQVSKELPILASDGVSTMVARLEPSLKNRLPLPWNPRDPRAQALYFTISNQQECLLLLERAYLEETLRVLGAASDHLEVRDFGTLVGIRLAPPAIPSDLIWSYYMPGRETP